MLLSFTGGAITMGFLIAGIFFLRFWKQANEELFLWFAGAFWLLAVGQIAVTFNTHLIEERSPLYLFRLAAFLLILIAVWRKNHSAM
jgi:hypothetical protein